MKYGNRSLLKRLVASPVAMIVAAVLLAVLAKAGWNLNEKARVSSSRLEQAQAELAKLRDREAKLSDTVGYLSTERGLENEIRSKYHAIREGESVAVIVDDSKTAAVVNASVTQATSSVGWFRRMLRVFGF
ncbi:MAG: hypothetical protein KBC33_00090 [Candidatus Pacebacteria bacterium]|nr:hypothetical protein [Candidatus Paceibacterota bacterium]